MKLVQVYKEENVKETVIGKLPMDWDVVTVGDILSLEYGRGLSDKERIPGSYPVLGSNGVIGYHDRALIDGPGVVVGRKGTIGAVTWIDSNFWPIDTTYYVKTKITKISLKWLFYELRHLNPARFNLADVVPGLKRELVYSLNMPLPPVKDQSTIAAVLSNVDQAIQKTDEIIAKTELLKKSLMGQLFTKGLGQKGFKSSEIGRIPEDWDVVRLGNALKLCQYGLSIPMNEQAKYPIVRMDELVDGYVSSEIAKRVDLDNETFQAFRLQKGDILFNRTNSYDLVGRTGIFLLEGNYVFASYLIRLRPVSNLFDPQFLTFYLSASRDRLRRLATKAVHQANINATNLKSMRVPLPSLSEQQGIASTLRAVDKKLDVERNEKKGLEKAKQGLMDLLLSGKIRIKVG